MSLERALDIQWTDADIISLLLDDGDISSDTSSESSDWSLFEDEDDDDSPSPGPASDKPRRRLHRPTPLVVPSRYRAAAQHLSDEEFFEEFRINRRLVESLTERFRESSFYNDHAFGKYKPLSAYDHLLAFLWFAGHRSTFKSTCEQFGLSNGSLYRIIRRVMGFLASMSDAVISWPNENEIKDSAEYFREKGIPFTIGAIAVEQIKIDKPGEEEGYFNSERKSFTTPLQVVCDHRKYIRDISIGSGGSDDNSTVFLSSTLNENLEHVCAHYVILGDHTFPCLRNLVTPYHGSAEKKKKLFNNLLSQGRATVQGCIKKLRMKFPQLTHCKLRVKEDINQFVTACCVLHNLSLDDDYLQNVGYSNRSSLTGLHEDSGPEGKPGDVHDTPAGLEYREDLLTALSIRGNWK